MLTLLKCIGLIVGGIFISKILTGLADVHSEKKRKEQEEYQKLLDAKRELDYIKMVQEAERDAEIDAKLEKMKNEKN